jgi:hypothetical protein
MAKFKRSQLLVEPRVQLSLIRHVCIYWFCTAATVEFLNLTRQIALGPQQASFWDYLFNENSQQALIRLAIGSLLVLPLVIYDMLRLSNRFAGPIFRMRRTLRKVAANGAVENVQLRDGDFWGDFAEELNAALALMDSQRQQPGDEADRPVEEPLSTR